MAEPLELLSEILDKLIETQVQNAQVTADLKNAVEDNNKHLKDVHDLLTKVNSHFSNGFRQELKESIIEAAKQIENSMEIKYERGEKESRKTFTAITNFTNALKSPKLWIEALLIIASVIGVVVGTVTVITKLVGGP